MLQVEALYRTFGPMVLRRCRRILGDEQRALDAMQETFVRVLRFQSQLDADAPSSLLFRMATNVSLNMRRSERRRGDGRTDPIDDVIAAVDDSLGHTRRMLAKIFAGEQERTLLIAVLHLVDGMTLEEVAAEVGMSVSGVRKRLRGLKARAVEGDTHAAL